MHSFIASQSMSVCCTKSARNTRFLPVTVVYIYCGHVLFLCFQESMDDGDESTCTASHVCSMMTLVKHYRTYKNVSFVLFVFMAAFIGYLPLVIITCSFFKRTTLRKTCFVQQVEETEVKTQNKDFVLKCFPAFIFCSVSNLLFHL